MSCTHFLHRCVDDISRIRASVLIPLSLIGGFKNNHFAQQAMLQEPSRIFKLWQTVWSAWSFMDRCLEVLTRTRAASAVKKNRQIFNVWIRTGGTLLWNMFSQWGPSILMYSTLQYGDYATSCEVLKQPVPPRYPLLLRSMVSLRKSFWWIGLSDLDPHVLQGASTSFQLFALPQLTLFLLVQAKTTVRMEWMDNSWHFLGTWMFHSMNVHSVHRILLSVLVEPVRW